jgi:hypothetical protein
MNDLDVFAATLLSATDAESPFAVGTVASFVSNGANPPTVTVTWNGTQAIAACPRHYTPVVGHVVLMARFGPQLNILGAY